MCAKVIDNKELLNGLRTISNFCQQQDRCDKCVLYNGYDCAFYEEDLSPYEWADEFESMMEQKESVGK